MQLIKVNFRKATVLVAFLFSTQTPNCFASSENFLDIIEKSHNLSLQKNRPHAVSVLVKALKKEAKKGKLPKELLLSLQEISESFYSDKAQQLYELALTLRHKDSVAAIAKLNEALATDPENLLIQLEIARNEILKSDCNKSLLLGKKLKELNPFDEKVDLLIFQSSICNGKLGDLAEYKVSEFKNPENSIYWHLIQGEYNFRRNELDLVKTNLAEAVKMNPEYPQIYYWTWKLQVEQKENAGKVGERYLTECKRMTKRKLRQHLLDPFLCQNTTEVENFLKKQ